MSTDPALNLTSTTGLLQADGVAIEQLRGGRMLLWAGGQQQVGSEVVYEGKRYVAAALLPSLETQLAFPASAEPFGSVEDLADSIQSTWSRTVPTLDSLQLELLAGGIFATWVVDCLPSPPVFLLQASPADCQLLVRVLEALVRRPLVLANPTLREVSKLEPGLCPTVILSRPQARTVDQLLPALTHGPVLLEDGGCRKLCSAVWIVTDAPLQVNAVTLHIVESETYLRLAAGDVHRIREELQPKLLRYRLEHHAEVQSACFDVPQLSSPLRVLARSLGCALEGSVGLQLALTSALKVLDEQIKVGTSTGDRAVVLESLLVLCHEGKDEAVVGEVAAVATDIRAARGDARKMEPKSAGSILRSLGLNAVRKNGGYTLALDPDSKQKIHRLAAREGALMVVEPKPDCVQCQPWIPAPEIPIELEDGL